MTIPTSTHEPLYIEIPEQRMYKFTNFLAQHSVFVFLLGSLPFVTFIPLHFYVILAVAACALMIVGYQGVNKMRPIVKEKLRGEFTQQTGLALPDSFDPQSLPKGTFPEKVSVTDQSGTVSEWTAARKGTFFRLAPN